jgi:L-type amino acid transporter 9
LIARNLPLAILIGLPLVTICYFFVNIAYFTVASADEIINQPVAIVSLKAASRIYLKFNCAASFTPQQLFGSRMLGSFAFLMPLTVALSTFGAANGTQFSAARYFPTI